MFKRIGKVSVGAVFLALMSGCVEMTQTITLNPNGSGKVVYDVKMPADMGIGADPKKQAKTPDETLLQEVQKKLTTSKGVTAWKDVSAKWTEDGKLHFVGTAYFDKLEDVGGNDGGGGMSGPSFGAFQVKLENGELLRITTRKDPNANANPNTNNPAMPDLANGTAKQWDDFVLMNRINYQKIRPLLVMMFTDLKVTTVFRVPGEVKDSAGFKKEGAGLVHTMDGNVMIAAMKKIFTQDAAGWKKMMASGDPRAIMERMGLSQEMAEPSMTVHRLGKAQFDYAREVEAARAEYPRLRQQFKLDAEKKLPGEQ
jgi:hypothetical protein